MQWWLAVLVAAAMSGCIASPADVSESVQSPVAAEPWVAHTDCTQVRSYIDVLRQTYASRMPEGFTFYSEDEPSVTASAVVWVESCPEAVELWVGLHVRPPESAANRAYDLEALLLHMATSNATDAATYAAWGLEPGTLTHFAQTGGLPDPLASQGVEVDAGDAHYSLTWTRPGGGPNGGSGQRFWIVEGKTATSFVLAFTSVTNQGANAGTALLEQSGDPDLPERASGGTVVTGSSVVTKGFERLP